MRNIALVMVLSCFLVSCGKEEEQKVSSSVAVPVASSVPSPEVEKLKAEAEAVKAEMEKLKAEAEAQKVKAEADRVQTEQKAEAEKVAAVEAAKLTSEQACKLAKAFKCVPMIPDSRYGYTLKVLGCEKFMSFSEKGTAKIRVTAEWSRRDLSYPGGPIRKEHRSHPYLLTKSDSGWVVEKCGGDGADL